MKLNVTGRDRAVRYYRARMIRRLFKNRLSGRRWSQPLWETLHRVSLYGMNFGSGDVSQSGERWLLERIALAPGGPDPLVIVDVGANVGDYADAVLGIFGQRAQLYCLEPSPRAFRELESRIGSRARCYQIGASDDPGVVTLYAPEERSGLASLYRRRWKDIGVTPAEHRVSLTTLDRFCAEQRIDHIDLLKIDVEGHELAVIKGAEKLLGSKAVDVIQFEFGGTDIDARVFFRDIFDLLARHGFAVFRLLRDGLRPIGRYSEACEVFLTINYVAARSGSNLTGL